MMCDEPVDSDRWFAALRWMLDLKQGRTQLEVPILNDRCEQIGTLSPISVKHLADAELLERFVRWRNQNLSGYLDQRPVTLEGVKRYVEDVVYNPTRLTFLAYCDGRPIGRLGAVRIGPREHESDGLVRGERGGGLNFMHSANIAMMLVLFQILRQQRITARVLSSNDFAIDSCQRLGFCMTPILSQEVFQIEVGSGVILQTYGRDDQRVSGVTLDTFAIDRSRFFATMNGRRSFEAMTAVLPNMLTSATRTFT